MKNPKEKSIIHYCDERCSIDFLQSKKKCKQFIYLTKIYKRFKKGGYHSLKIFLRYLGDILHDRIKDKCDTTDKTTMTIWEDIVFFLTEKEENKGNVETLQHLLNLSYKDLSKILYSSYLNVDIGSYTAWEIYNITSKYADIYEKGKNSEVMEKRRFNQLYRYQCASYLKSVHKEYVDENLRKKIMSIDQSTVKNGRDFITYIERLEKIKKKMGPDWKTHHIFDDKELNILIKLFKKLKN